MSKPFLVSFLGGVGVQQAPRSARGLRATGKAAVSSIFFLYSVVPQESCSVRRTASYARDKLWKFEYIYIYIYIYIIL